VKHALVSAAVFVLCLTISPAVVVAQPAQPPGTIAAVQTATSPDDFALTSSGDAGQAPSYRKLLLNPETQRRVLALQPKVGTAEATVIVYDSTNPPARHSSGAGLQLPTGLAWTGQAVLATAGLAAGLATAGVLLLLLARRRKDPSHGGRPLRMM
jgi:hypothetical protein